MHAVILERNKLVGRKVARLFMSTGATALSLEDPALVADSLTGADLICADAFDADLVAEQLRARPGLRGVLWTAEPLRRTLKYMIESTAIDHVLGRKAVLNYGSQMFESFLRQKISLNDPDAGTV